MGWFDTSSAKSPLESPKPSNDGGFIAPDRTARTKCWEARDAFFQCLDENSIIDSIKQDEKAKKACGAELKGFEKDCASSWITYFKKRRVMEFQRAETMKRIEAENAQPINGNGKM